MPSKHVRRRKEVIDMIELFLSTDGKHTVHVTAETPAEMAILVPEAKALYQDVLHTYGTKAEMWGEVMNGNGQAPAGKRVDTVQEAPALYAPVCPVHQKQMVLRTGRRGQFWSCHTHFTNGEWCKVTQEVTKAPSTQIYPA
jgi:hypothetical protein